MIAAERSTAERHADLSKRAVRSAEIALLALERITALLDEDCETQAAFYNPRATVACIRRELESAAEDLTALEREAHS